MKRLFVCLAMLAGSIMMADTIVIRQPGLVEGVCSAAFGTVRCVGEFATGLVAGNTTVIQTPAVAHTVVTATPAVITPGYVQTPVVCTPAVVTQPVVIAPNPVTCVPCVYPCRSGYGPRYIPCHRHCRGYHRPCRPCNRTCLGNGRYGGLLSGPGPVYAPCY